MKINTGHLPLLDPAPAPGLMPVRDSAADRAADLPPVRRPLPSRAITSGEKDQLEAKASRFIRSDEDGLAENSKSRQAIRAYQSLSEGDEREQVSLLLGVDEYA